MEFSDLFDLSDNDYAVDLLTRVFGGVVEFVSGEGGSLTDGTLLTDLISIFNTACLLLALIVGSYTTYVLVFDTAADGKTFGNQSDTKYTVVHILVGAISFVPIQGGLTVAQLALIWLSVQGSALGDVAWRTVADGALRDEPVLAASAPLSETDYLINQQFANTLYALSRPASPRRGLTGGHARPCRTPVPIRNPRPATGRPAGRCSGRLRRTQRRCATIP